MSDFLSLFTYRNLLIVEAAVLVLVLALTLRKPEVITTKSGNTVERPRSRTGLICTLLLLAVTWALHMTGFQLSVIFQKGKNIVAILEKLFRPRWDFFPKVITPLVDTIKMSILGYVGAGGLGITINERIGWRDYNGLGMVLLSLLVVVVSIEFLSEFLRKKLS